MMVIYSPEIQMADDFTGGMNRYNEKGWFIFSEALRDHLVHV
ncbi:hypothetical protein ACVWYN_002932 [Pedobacter sp. UYP24]